MSNQEKYESRIRKAALLGTLENGLRDGGKCLVCQCWKKPCATCERSAQSRRAPSANGASPAYQRAARQLG